MATLEVLDGPKKGHRLELVRDEIIIGRLSYCDLVLPQKSISRQHTRVLRSGNGYFVEDMNSTNGTFVNGRRITARTPIDDRDRISIYDVNLLFHADRQEAISTDDDEGDSEQANAATTPPKSPDSIVSTLSATGSTNFRDRDNLRLRAILEINRVLGATLDVNRVLPKILDGLFTVFSQSDRGYILVPDAETGKLKVVAEKYTQDQTFISSKLGPIPAHVASRVLLKAEAVLSQDGIDGSEFDVSDSVLDMPIRSMMCAPLIGPRQRPVGIIYVDTNSETERFNAEDLEVLISVAASAGKAIEYAQAHEAVIQLDRREREMSMAKAVQLHFLPQDRPAIESYRFFDHYRSAQEIGGDYYGYLRLPDGRLAITVGDVAGKGVTAALVMARLCADVRYHLVTAGGPEQAVELLNRELAPRSNEWGFVTFIICLLDPASHELTIVNAGHMLPLVKRANGEVEYLDGDHGGPPLGCLEDACFRGFTWKLAPGESMLLYTDGINEAMNKHDQVYGLERLKVAARTGPNEVQRLCLHVLNDMRQFVDGHPQNDDICLVGFQRLQ